MAVVAAPDRRHRGRSHPRIRCVEDEPLLPDEAKDTGNRESSGPTCLKIVDMDEFVMHVAIAVDVLAHVILEHVEDEQLPGEIVIGTGAATA